ncbi:MAG: EamA family transporter [Candidatus Omnitrophica bacterium]|nr:EamA family transporter [Candidatus Omnitrophota bacterium]
MDTIAFSLVLLSAFLHAIREFLTKLGRNKHSFILLYRIAGIALFFPIFVYCVMRYPMNGWGLALAFVSGLIHCFYYIGLGETLNEGEISVVYPITRCTPIFLIFWSYFVAHEKMTLWGVAGILLVIVGTFSIQLDRHNMKKALTAIFRFTSYPVRMAWVVAVITALYSIVDSKGVSFINAFVYLYVTYFLSILFHMIFIFRNIKKEEIMAEWRGNTAKIILAGFVSLFGYLLMLLAFTTERVTYLLAIRQSSVVFGVLLGIAVLKEKNKFIRFSSTIVIYAGICLIALFG